MVRNDSANGGWLHDVVDHGGVVDFARGCRYQVQHRRGDKQ